MAKFLTSGNSMFYLWRYKWNIYQYVETWLSRIKVWRQNARTRKQLAKLDPHFYRDIGLTEKQVQHEIQKKFWQ